MSANHGARWTSCHSSRSSDSSGPPRQARIYAARPISSPPAGCSSSDLYMCAGACAHRRASSAPEQKMSPPYAISAGVVPPAHHSPEKGQVLFRVVVATPAHRAGPATQTTNQVGDTNSSPHTKAHLVCVSWTAVDRCWGRTSHTSAPSWCGCSSGCPHGNASSLLKWGWTEDSVRTGPLRRKEADTPRGAAVVAAGRVKAQGPWTPRPTEGLGPMLLRGSTFLHGGRSVRDAISQVLESHLRTLVAHRYHPCFTLRHFFFGNRKTIGNRTTSACFSEVSDQVETLTNGVSFAETMKTSS